MPDALETLTEFELDAQSRGHGTIIQVLRSSDGDLRLWMAREALASPHAAELLREIATLCTKQAELLNPAGRA